MSGRTVGKRSPGLPFDPRASEWNAIADVVNAAARGVTLPTDSGASIGRRQPAGVVRLRNNTGVLLEPFEIVGIEFPDANTPDAGVAIDPADDAAGWLAWRHALAGVDAVPTRSARWAMALDFIDDARIGPALYGPELWPVKLYVEHEDHTHAGPRVEGAAELVGDYKRYAWSGWAGRRIVWKQHGKTEAPDGAKLALVEFGSLTSAGPLLATAKGQIEVGAQGVAVVRWRNEDSAELPVWLDVLATQPVEDETEILVDFREDVGRWSITGIACG